MRLDSIGHPDMADAIERLVLAQSGAQHPSSQPQMQWPRDPTGTMRGPAGAAWLRDEEEQGEEAASKQVEPAPRKKVVPKIPGIVVGTDVDFDIHHETPGTPEPRTGTRGG